MNFQSCPQGESCLLVDNKYQCHKDCTEIVFVLTYNHVHNAHGSLAGRYAKIGMMQGLPTYKKDKISSSQMIQPGNGTWYIGSSQELKAVSEHKPCIESMTEWSFKDDDHQYLPVDLGDVRVIPYSG